MAQKKPLLAGTPAAATQDMVRVAQQVANRMNTTGGNMMKNMQPAPRPAPAPTPRQTMEQTVPDVSDPFPAPTQGTPDVSDPFVPNPQESQNKMVADAAQMKAKMDALAGGRSRSPLLGNISQRPVPPSSGGTIATGQVQAPTQMPGARSQDRTMLERDQDRELARQQAISMDRPVQQVRAHEQAMMKAAMQNKATTPVKEQKKAMLRQLFSRVKTGNVSPEQAEDEIMNSNQFSREEKRKLLMYMWQNQAKLAQSNTFGV